VVFKYWGEYMKKINILKKTQDFNRIINNNNNKPFKYKDYIIYIEKKESGFYNFGLSVGKKIGNAVTRNKYKRRLKNIIDEKSYENSFNCIIIVGKGILNRSFEEMRSNLFEAFDKLNIIKEK